jgi:hypothetical protein
VRWVEFPQNSQYFHKKIAVRPCCVRGNREYLSIQRRSDPPEGESGQEPSENRKRDSQEHRGRNSRGTGSGTRKGAGKGTPDENRERGLEENRQRNLEKHRRRFPQGNRRGDSKGNPKRDSRSTQATGCRGWNKKALAANGMTEEYGKRGLRPKAPDNSEVTTSCDLCAEPDLRKSDSEGRDLEREIALLLLSDLISRSQKRCGAFRSYSNFSRPIAHLPSVCIVSVRPGCKSSRSPPKTGFRHAGSFAVPLLSTRLVSREPSCLAKSLPALQFECVP